MKCSKESWSCKIALRFETDPSGKSISNVHELQFGKIIYDPKKVEKVLRKAQLAILNPHMPKESILTLNDEQLEKIRAGGEIPGNTQKSLSFSTNVIVIDIAGRDVTDLAFVDLPVSRKLLDV